jgi:purine-nucleoside/S-methyl-5'-thioadenosine phosphorylase / adenosine deaminase
MSTSFFHPHIFKRFPEIAAVHSLRNPSQPGNFSMLYAADEPILEANRATFAQIAGFPVKRLAFPRLEHGDTIIEVADNYDTATRPQGDALITDKAGWLIGAAVADCVVVLLYDPTHHAIAAVHSGWRGSAKNIVGKTISTLTAKYASRPADILAYLSPSPMRDEYEVGHEVSQQFDATYSTPKSETKDWFDNKLVIYDQLLAAGLSADHIESDPRSTMADNEFHSYRRDGKASGRMIVAIGRRESDA